MELKIYNPQQDGFLQKIEWNFDELKAEITERTSDYLNLVYNNSQIKEAKKDRANLRKLVTALENKRKEIKREIMIPYDDFVKKEKELVEIINGAITNIDTQVKEYEDGQKQEKAEKIEEIYAEVIGEMQDVVLLEKIYDKSWLNATKTLKTIRSEITEIRDRVAAELKVINADGSRHAYEMKEEYLKSYDFAAAMKKKQELEDMAKKKALIEQQEVEKAERKQEKLRQEAEKVMDAGNAPEQKTFSDTESFEEYMKECMPAKKERTLAITFRCVAKESNFAVVNRKLSELKKMCEEFAIESKEEL